MRHLLAALILLLPVAAFAQFPENETGPNFNEPSRREVPNPLPPDFDECVVVVWNEQVKAEVGENGAWYSPPLTEEQKAEIQAGLNLQWGSYSLCQERGA